MKKIVCAFAIAAALSTAPFALEVNKNELQTTTSDTIQFENYSGPHAVIETASAITNIGTNLGKEIAADVNNSRTINPSAKYSIIHSVSEPDGDKLDADIFIINSNATVDHIKNLRRILTGYLEAAYSYNHEDADTIATFITVYNAVYRGQLNVFKEKYKAAVQENLTEESVGLSTNWSEWSGRTQIVIPLSDLDGGLSVIDTSVISDENVISQMKETDDKGIDARTNMADLKSREAAEASKKSQEAQKDAVQQKNAAKEAQKTANAAKEAAKADPNNKEKQQNAEQAQKKAVEQKKKAEDASAKASVQQQKSDKKLKESQGEKEQIARDKNKKAALDNLDNENYVNGLVRTDEKNELYGLVKVDSTNGKIIRTSSMKQIRGHTMYTVKNVTVAQEDGSNTVYPAMYITIGGVSGGHSAVKLCLIDTKTLEMQKESTESLSETSPLIQQGGDFYAVVIIDGSYYVGKFDQNLTLKQRSSITVKDNTPISITTKGFLVTASDGKPAVLKTADLTTTW